MDYFATLIALLATVPYATFFVIFYISKKITNQATRSTKLAADWSSLFFILAVNALLFLIFDYSFLIWFLVMYMVAMIIVITIQWRNEIDVNFRMAFRVVWRAGFILLAISYIVLLPIGIYMTY
ncbi:DUF3397 domain-containing protein [Piscibacillus halophilus]|uniref:DUF3397 domain-containing protein n=1 Tax=Piscibacillus halophilus TaxID=571933 RepID=A0A1H8YSP5_9BACI|nr:DUF3397 domain-containing protein [Piscibacillus halophilus]SEP55123.1 Protein of unknown function [Piscibacillus halophilus]